ncbi:peptidylprolyl isomerase [Hyphococcus sp.]|jgi:peptidylprolyl isomerase|uniref:peptidylprolyl isomerase n=1 Tax=Hyphococcus sp. TaxID=2038636 RepID=UPI003D0A3D20
MRKLFLMLILLAAACSPAGDGEPVEMIDREVYDARDDGDSAPKRGPGQIVAESAPEDWRALDPESLLVIELERGRVVVALSEKLAQKNVAQVKALAREGFYDGLSFYRVIDGFVAQGGDVFETREIKSAAKTVAGEFDEPLTTEMIFTPMKDGDGYAEKVGFVDSEPVGVEGDTVWKLHCTGAMAMARGNERDSGGTEFYIALQPQRYLDRNLTAFGHVVDGMEHVQLLRRVAPPETEEDDRGEEIISMHVAADLPEEERPRLEILRTDTETFADLVESRRNRPEDFFYYRPGHVDICAMSIPVRPVASATTGE